MANAFDDQILARIIGNQAETVAIHFDRVHPESFQESVDFGLIFPNQYYVIKAFFRCLVIELEWVFALDTANDLGRVDFEADVFRDQKTLPEIEVAKESIKTTSRTKASPFQSYSCRHKKLDQIVR